MEKYAFISYSSKNQQTADAVRQAFKKEGIPCWMAPYDIPPGSKYAFVINDALEGCSCVVLLLSKESQESNFVTIEVDRAITYEKPIIPMQLDDLKLNSGFRFYLGSSQIIAVHDINTEAENFKRVLDGVRHYVGYQEKLSQESMAEDSLKKTEKTDKETETASQESEETGSNEDTDGSYDEDLEQDNAESFGINGIHTFTWAGGTRYVGEWKNNQCHGKGKMFYSNGAVFEGNYVHHKKEGQGKLTFADGSGYEGEWKDDKKNGHGRYTFADGSSYEGEWKDDKMNGYGRHTFSNGVIYEGDWVSGVRTGQGKLIYPEGSVYEGGFLNNKRSGQGKLTYKDGSVLEGEWKDDKPV